MNPRLAGAGAADLPGIGTEVRPASAHFKGTSLNEGERGAVRQFLGEPRALAFLSFTEAWERFSYYGMTAILVLYMTHALLPGGEQAVAGLAALHSMLDRVFGSTTALGFGSRIFGLYTGFVYFTPILGGWIADRFVGRKPAVIAGALLMTAGHIAMAFNLTFLLALMLLICGCGLLKGNISAQVGSLYAPEDAAGRTRAFAIFSIGINFGAILGPLVIGLLADRYGWHVGFGLAGLLMFVGLATYLAGYRTIADTARTSARPEATPLNRAERRAIIALLIAMAITIFQSVAYYQNLNMALVWIDSSVDLSFYGFHVPVAWFTSIDPAASVILVPVLFAYWRRRASAGRPSGEVSRIAHGAWIAAAANMLLVAASLRGGRVPVMVPLAYNVLLGLGFLFYWPTLLALVSRAAPARLNSTMMGAAFLTLFVANNAVGLIGAYYDRMSPAYFWGLQSAIGASGAVIAMLLRSKLERMLPPVALEP